MITANFVPKRVFFTKGVGKHKEKLESFELALRDAGIAHCNLVTVSSIYPPNCKVIPRKRGVKFLKPGQIAFVVLARNESDEPNRLIVASLGCAIPADKNQPGYISEHHTFGQTAYDAGEYAEDLAASMLASSFGIEFDPEQAWNERKKIYEMGKKIVRSFNVTQSARVDKRGWWTTVVVAVVFLF